MMSGPCSSLAILMSSESHKGNPQDRAYVLHSRPFKNSSLILEVFTEQHGRLDLVAKGARRSESTYQGLLQPFSPLFIVWGGRSELKTLYKAEALSLTQFMKGERLFAAFYVNELLMYLLHKHEAHPDLFTRYSQCLQQIAGQDDLEICLRYFELDMLNELGYGPVLDYAHDNDEPVQATGQYHYHLERGVSIANFADPNILQITGSTLLALAQRQLASERDKLEAKKLLRYILDAQLDGRPLKTRELYLNKSRS